MSIQIDSPNTEQETVTEIHSALHSALKDIARDVFDCEATPIKSAADAGDSNGWHYSFLGDPKAYEVGVAADLTSSCWLAHYLLQLAENEDVSTELLGDAFSEVANLIVGRFKAYLDSPEKFHLETPRSLITTEFQHTGYTPASYQLGPVEIRLLVSENVRTLI